MDDNPESSVDVELSAGGVLLHPPESQPSVAGYVDGIRDGHVHGWALNRHDPAERMHVQLTEGVDIICDALADILREDLGREGHADARHGFAIAIPDRLRDGDPHVLSVIIAATGEALAGGPCTFTAAQADIKAAGEPNADFLGYVDGVHDGAVHGWVMNQTDFGERVVLLLRDGDTILGDVVADVNREDLAAAGYADTKHGFVFPIPDLIRDGRDHRLTIAMAETGEVFAGWSYVFHEDRPTGALDAAATVPAHNILGYVDGIRDGHVHGWAIDTADLGQRVVLQLREGETVLREQQADVLRDDLARAGYDDVRHGFAIAIPDQINDGQVHSLSVVVAVTGRALAGPALDYTGVRTSEPPVVATVTGMSQLAGFVESVADDVISGWCAIRGREAESVTLELRAGHDVVARVLADQVREDLKPAGFTNLRHGFSIAVPAVVKNGQSHVLTLVEAESGEPLAGWSLDYRRATVPPVMLDPSVDGQFEGVNGRRVTGWACDRRKPDRPVELYVTIDGTPKLMIVADRPRADVAAAGIGNGRNGFEYDLPEAVFDGEEHEVAVVVAESGGRLKGELVRVKMSREGAAFLDRRSAAIDGWARNASRVVVKFDNGEEVVARLDRPVAGFLSNDNPGFRVPIPTDLLDNGWHSAEVVYANDSQPLDGSPILFRLTKPETVLDFVALSGRRLTGRIYDVREPSKPVTLSIEVDGAPFATITADRWRAAEPTDPDERLAQEFSFLLPAQTRTFGLRRLDGRDTSLLASWRLTPDMERERLPPTVATELSRAAIEAPQTKAAVEDAFAAFRDAPGDDFDEAWYLAAYPDAAGDVARGAFASALDHYVAAGARAGHSPSAFFDEGGIRAALPPIARAIETGHLHSAFGLYLHLGKGDALDPVPGFASHAYVAAHPQAAGANPLLHMRTSGLSPWPSDAGTSTGYLAVPALPRRLDQRNPATSIYGAWMNRLDLKPEVHARLAADEAAMRNFVTTRGVTRSPRISIVMPTFNRAYTIAEAIQSVLDQTYQNWELLICDDASTDRTPMVVAQFQDSRIRYMQFEKSNGAATRNKGLRYANGEYIAYLDSDNLWDPLFLDVMLRSLLDNPGQSFAYAGYLDTEIVGSVVRLEKLSLPDFNGIALSNRNFIDLNTIMHHRRVYDWLGGFDESLERLQDWDLVLRFTSIFNPIFVPYCLAYYRRNIAWGQVTHLFLESNIQNTVAEKTAARLDRGHERLKVRWPSRPRLAILAQGGEGHARAARTFAELAAPYADITFVGVDSNPNDGRLSGLVLPPNLFQNPARLGYALSLVPDCAATVSFGSDAGYLRRLLASQVAPMFQAVVASDGVHLTHVTRSNWSFHLGALPLSATVDKSEPGDIAGGASATVGVMFSISGKPAANYLDGLKIDGHFELLLAPQDPFEGTWSVFRNGKVEALGLDGEAAVAAARRLSKFVISAAPLGELSMGAQSFVFDRMAAGTPTLLAQDSYGQQLSATNAVYAIDVADYAWIFDKLPKLFKSDTTLDRLRKNGRRSYLVRMHPELVQERIVSFIHQLAFGEQPDEVVHVA